MRNIKLTLEYDGSAFFGFQKQPHHPTIQAELEKALSKILNRKTKIAAASGRTDAGVHALSQIVNFRTKSPRLLKQIQNGLNHFLPHSIAIKKVEEVSDQFHARYSAKSKTYEYLIWNHPVRSPLWAKRAWHVPEKLNLKAMKQAARILKGHHDFRSFCAARGTERHRNKEDNTVRNVRQLLLKKEGDLIRILVTADGFLYHMVRNIAGSLVEVGRSRLSTGELRKIVQRRDRRLAPATAPAAGLMLVNVTY